MERNYLSRDKHREDSFSFEEHTWGTSWPARNYTCSFCKREFRSAQALGGHMNVHRRDRARLRSGIPSWVSECPKPNPNPTTKPNPTLLLSPSSLSPLSAEVLNYSHRSPLYSPSLQALSSSPSLASTSDDKKPTLTSSQLPLLSPQSREINMNYKKAKSAFGSTEELKVSAKEEEHRVLKNNEDNITLELGIGLLKHSEEKLDLELRLGHF